jgi:hypothetical protein
MRIRGKQDDGYALGVLMVWTTVLLVGLTAAEISWQKRMQREREEELIFRGKQYMRAIMLWKQKFRVAAGGRGGPWWGPTTMDALLNTNGYRFLRKKWKDPITDSENWRIIRVPGAGGSGRGFEGAQFQSKTSPGTPAGSQMGSTGRGGFPGLGGSSSSATGAAGSNVMFPIFGVASTSEKESLKTYNGRSHYNQWEFVFLDGMAIRWSTGPGNMLTSVPGGASPPPTGGLGTGLGRSRDRTSRPRQ